MKRAALLYMTVLLMVAGCRVRSGLEAIDLAHVYHKEGIHVRPEVRLFHVDNNRTDVHFRFDSDQLLYIRPAADAPFYARARVEVFVYEDFDQKELVDSVSLSIGDSQMVKSPHKLGGQLQVEIPGLQQQETYVVLFRLRDRNRRMVFDKILLLERTNPFNRQNFLLTDALGEVIFRHWVAPDDTVRVRYAQSRDSALFVHYYNRQFSPAPPPYVSNETPGFDKTPDSTFALHNGQPVVLRKQGFYHFMAQRDEQDGFTVYVFEDAYPRITRRKQLSGPLRYLTTNLEFDGIDRTSPDSLKYEVDRFWLNRAGSPNRAVLQLEEFYERVEYANRFFTSYHEGWKTDRGILYTVYGPPSGIYRTINTETWVYGEEASSLSFTFVFDRMINPFTDNDYSLRREPEYRYGWGLAIEAWRHGRIFDEAAIKQAQHERDQQLRQTAPPYLWY